MLLRESGIITLKGGMLICYIQIITKIRKFDVSSSYKNDEGYVEFIQYIGEVISSQSLYSQSFGNLVYEVFESKNWKQSNLVRALDGDFSRQTLYKHLYDYISDKEKTLKICIALGLDLVMTMIFLISKGFILNPKIPEDKKTMMFINTFKGDGLNRVLDYYNYIENN